MNWAILLFGWLWGYNQKTPEETHDEALAEIGIAEAKARVEEAKTKRTIARVIGGAIIAALLVVCYKIFKPKFL